MAQRVDSGIDMWFRTITNAAPVVRLLQIADWHLPSRMSRLAVLVAPYLLNLLVAILGTELLQSMIVRYATLPPTFQVVRTEYLCSVLIPFGLGLSAYYTWQSSSAKWLWVAGVFWFGRGAILFWLEQRELVLAELRHPMIWEMSGTGCAVYEPSCVDFIAYTIPLVRTVLYSMGALCCSLVRPQIASIIHERIRHFGGSHSGNSQD